MYVFTTEEVFSTVGDTLSTVGDVKYRGGYHAKYGGYILSTVGVFSTVGDIMIHVGDIMSTKRMFNTVEVLK